MAGRHFVYITPFVSMGLLAVTEPAIANQGLDLSVQYTTYLHITGIIANAFIRVSAIAAGVYVVWLGHNTLIRGVKGDFEFDGKWGKLKGSTPGLLFVLLGVTAIGWSLGSKFDSHLNIPVTAERESERADSGPKPGSSIAPSGAPTEAIPRPTKPAGSG